MTSLSDLRLGPSEAAAGELLRAGSPRGPKEQLSALALQVPSSRRAMRINQSLR